MNDYERIAEIIRYLDARHVEQPDLTTLAYLIPCHRVIRETGVIGDYHWGRIRKRAMIAWEGSQRFASALETANR